MKTSEKKLKVNEFIQNVLIDGIKTIVETHHYLAFALVTQGIEILGTINEPSIPGTINDFDTQRLSRKRFRYGLAQFKNSSIYLTLLCHN